MNKNGLIFAIAEYTPISVVSVGNLSFTFTKWKPWTLPWLPVEDIVLVHPSLQTVEKPCAKTVVE